MKNKANEELKNYAKKEKVAVWEIAYKLGVCENTLHRHLRIELESNEKDKVFDAIKTIVAERAVG